MQTISKIIYWASLTAIILFVIVPIIGHFTPLEFTKDSFEELFEQIRFFGLPVAILLTLFGTLKAKDAVPTKIAKTGLTICGAAFSVFILFMTAFEGMCRWTNNKVLFENKGDQTTKIVLRDFGCGATDSGSPTYKVCKIKTITPLLIWVTDIDTTKINKQIWQRVDYPD